MYKISFKNGQKQGSETKRNEPKVFIYRVDYIFMGKTDSVKILLNYYQHCTLIGNKLPTEIGQKNLTLLCTV